MPKCLIDTIELQSGSSQNEPSLRFKAATVNVFVGPNHSGKSLVLQELESLIRDVIPVKTWKVLASANFVPWSLEEKNEAISALCEKAQDPLQRDPQSVSISNDLKNYTMRMESFRDGLAQIGNARDVGKTTTFREYFLIGKFLRLGGEERLAILNPAERLPPSQRHKQLLARLFYNDSLRTTVQAIVKDAFGRWFVIDPLDKNFQVKLSSVPPNVETERSLTDQAVEFYKNCVHMRTMSDGVRAFSGMVAAVVGSEADVILIDEPEAFLHPALCTKLARQLCAMAQNNGRQVFVSTHSAPFLMGCVQAGVNINIVRLTYHREAATSRILPTEELIPLMRQPLLRSIGALTGIFYGSVIVTEADADRAFYDEINHRCLMAGHPSGIPDCLFLNAQNWQTTAQIIEPLRRLGIAAAAIVDIDLLLEEKSEAFQRLVEAAGMPPGTRQAIGQLRGQLHLYLKALRKELKSLGKKCVEGNHLRDLESFIDQLARYGVFVVPVGELECWLPELKREPWSTKSDWMLQTFAAMGEDSCATSYLKPSAGDVWDFMKSLRNWLEAPSRLGME